MKKITLYHHQYICTTFQTKQLDAIIIRWKKYDIWRGLLHHCNYSPFCWKTAPIIQTKLSILLKLHRSSIVTNSSSFSSLSIHWLARDKPPNYWPDCKSRIIWTSPILKYYHRPRSSLSAVVFVIRITLLAQICLIFFCFNRQIYFILAGFYQYKIR